MKKLFLLLILSFFSAQGFSGECPDGSDPVKSVSSDGTYYVYNCGGSSNNTSTSINSSSTTSASSGNIKKNFEVDSNSSHTLQFRDVYVDRDALRNKWWLELQIDWKLFGWGTASISYLDFDGDGDTDIFMSATSNNKNRKQVSEVYLNDGLGIFTLDRDFFADPPALFAPRKSIIGDYNGDGKEDIYVAGHGWDKPPFSGEPPVLILSSKAGYTTSVLNGFSGFQHGAASADVDADGDLDIIGSLTSSSVKSNKGVWMLINGGSGNFVPKKLQNVGVSGTSYYTVELVDVDQDGYVDLLLGGVDWTGGKQVRFTEIYWGSELGDYSNWNKTILPAVPGYANNAIDIDVGDIDNDGDKEGLGYYVGYHVQILKNNGDRSFTESGSMVATSPAIMDSTQEGGWIVWIRLVDIYNDGNLDIVVDDANRNLIWINSGSGSFTQLKDIRKIPGFEKKYKSCKKNCADLFLSKEEAVRVAEVETTASDNKVTSWWKNGQIKSEKNYKNGKRDGKYTTWFENGHKAYEANYKNGKRDGKKTVWFENGQIWTEENYKDDKLDGKVTNWNENGQILLELNYKYGELVSKTNDAARISEEEATKATETDTVETKESIEKELAAESKATISPTTEEATQPSQSETSEPIDYIEKLKQIKSLLDAGIINEEDFEKMKQKIIDKM